ncbi:MAG: 50S ribosomal protein L23 [Candidatus Nanoarchaeia archaeon]
MRPISSEKAVRLIEAENTLVFENEIKETKTSIKKEIEEMFKVKVDSVKTLRKANKKIAYVRLNKKNPAIDVATRLGMI